MKNHYSNATAYDAQVKTKSGKIYDVPSQQSRSTEKSDPFTKRKFEGYKWEKL